MTQLIPTKRKNLNGSLTFVVCVNNVPSFVSLSKSAKTRDLLHYYSQWVMTSFLALHLLKSVHVRLNFVQQQSVIFCSFLQPPLNRLSFSYLVQLTALLGQKLHCVNTINAYNFLDAISDCIFYTKKCSRVLASGTSSDLD